MYGETFGNSCMLMMSPAAGIAAIEQKVDGLYLKVQAMMSYP
jgi:hypothetical protein